MLFFLLRFIGLTRRSMLPICMIPGRKTSSYPTNNALPGRKSLSNKPAWRKTFFKARLDRLPEDELLSFDATEIASDAVDVTDALFGKGKEGGFQSQIRLILLLGQKSRLPVLFRLLPGNITDVFTVPDMLFRFDEITEKQRVFAAVLDRGYCSLDNIAPFAMLMLV